MTYDSKAADLREEPGRMHGTTYMSGELDMASADHWYEVAMAGVTGQRVIVDLSGVTFMDSTGLNVLIRVHQQRNLLITGAVPAQVRRLFQITGAEAVFDFVPSPEIS
ncbi:MULTISPECIES: STAS domain-containing protein [Streptomyces]|uniref:STAS domain-containing protein n=1 Tax=Streptomyces luteosporeus TaxID=173856 RepID=A0ABP6G9P9_9ACTN